MTKKLYILSGLGADERVFQLMDFSSFDVVFISWKQPLKNEKIEEYALRLSKEIEAENPVLVGLSFGGMMAVEIAKQIKTEKLVLIASAKTKNEIPFYYKIAGALKLHQLLPVRFLKRANFIFYWLFGAHTIFEKQLLKEIMADTDPVFLRWAINQIVLWKNIEIPENLCHIHGNADRILPIRNINADFIIPGGNHFMTINRCDELTKLLKQICV